LGGTRFFLTNENLPKFSPISKQIIYFPLLRFSFFPVEVIWDIYLNFFLAFRFFRLRFSSSSLFLSLALESSRFRGRKKKRNWPKEDEQGIVQCVHCGDFCVANISQNLKTIHG